MNPVLELVRAGGSAGAANQLQTGPAILEP